MKRFLILTGLLVTAAFCQSQTVDEIVTNYMNAMGGKEKLLSIRSLHITGVANFNGNEINTEVYKVQDKLYRSETNFGMGSFAILVVGDKGWIKSPRGTGSFEAMTEEQVKNAQYQMDCAGPLVNYAAKGHKAELIGREDVDGTECYKIKLTLKSGNEVNYFIDPKSWYIIRETSKGGGFGGGGGRGRQGAGGDNEMKIDYSNYQKTEDGYTFAMSVSRGFGGTMTFEKIEVNKPVDEKLYKAE
jgi:hypothetical protein